MARNARGSASLIQCSQKHKSSSSSSSPPLPSPPCAHGASRVRRSDAVLLPAVALIFPIEVALRIVIDPRANLRGVVLQSASMATTEEIFKLLVFYVVRRSASRVGDPREWIRDGILVGLAFSAIENALFLGNPLSIADALGRLFVSTVGHPAYMSVMAWGAA